HNRLRMIVAMFLTKDLFIDWRRGERYFMRRLVDGDLAANNGGWQWSASTGTDAAPYFRIFNPTSQSRKCDPDGAFIRRFVPELQSLSDTSIHEPWTLPADVRATLDYPSPIVDHAEARERILTAFKALT
ncbi:MAG: FAD-binding domain-containing protein, partial [Phycisphaerales bacterium]|nr:FAD-binding domain-containing protein [Phycisphaerales bacterium]